MVKTAKHLIYAKENNKIEINQNGAYRIHFRGVKDKVNITVKQGVRAFVSERFCPKTPQAEVCFVVEKDAEVVLSSFSDISSIQIRHNINIAEHGNFSGYFGFFGANVQDNWQLDLNKGSNAELNAVSFCKDTDNHSHIITTNQLQGDNKVKFRGRGIAVMQSICQFVTKGIIQKASAGSVCSHKSKVLTLSDEAKAEIDPSLYIDEYDVSAGHSGSVGRVNKEELFYMMSRGLSEHEVIKLISNGFLVSRIEGFLITSDRKRFYQAIEQQDKL
jgi:Fe-S cluster assembly scaffold protein SufB